MSMERGENWFDNDFHSSGKQFHSSDAKSFVWNGDNLPVDVLLSTLGVTFAPVDVTLAVSFAGPVLDLTLLGAVCPLFASST